MNRSSELIKGIYDRLEALEKAIEGEKELESVPELAKYHEYTIHDAMHKLREVVDELESIVPRDIWPYPTYGDLLYSVK